MSKVVQLKEKLNKKPEVTKAKAILENLNKVSEGYVSPKEVERLKEVFRKGMPNSWKATLSASGSYGDFVVKINTIPMKDIKAMAYENYEEYTKKNGRKSENVYKYDVVSFDAIDEDKKVFTKDFEIHVNPTKDPKSNNFKVRLEELSHYMKTDSQAVKKLAETLVEAMKTGYNNSDSQSDYFDQSFSVLLRFGDYNKPVKLS